MSEKTRLPKRDIKLDAALLERPEFVAIHTGKKRYMPQVDIDLFREDVRDYVGSALEFQEWYLTETVYFEDSFEENASARRQFYLDFVKENPLFARYWKGINALGRGLSSTVSSQTRVYADNYIGSNVRDFKEKIKKVTGLVEGWGEPVSVSETMKCVEEIKGALHEVLTFLSELGNN